VHAPSGHEHERRARRRGSERERAADAPAVTPERDRADHHERGVREEQHVDQPGVEPRERSREQPGVRAVTDAQQPSCDDLAPDRPRGMAQPDDRPEDRGGDQEPPGQQRPERRPGVERELRRDAEAGQEDRGRELR
jgi:hypothetical protein